MANPRPRRVPSAVLGLCAAAALLFFGTLHASAQALPAASKSMDVSAFGGFQYSWPDFGPDTDRDTGGTLGVNITRYFARFPFVAPSLEARGNYSSGPTITEKSFVAGLRLQTDVRNRFHPYANLLFGGGTIKYNPALGPLYTPDRGTVFSYGVGVDIDTIRHFQVKLDAQQQSWSLGPNLVTRPQGGDFTLSPFIITAGVAYRIPFRPHNKQ